MGDELLQTGQRTQVEMESEIAIGEGLALLSSGSAIESMMNSDIAQETDESEYGKIISAAGEVSRLQDSPISRETFPEVLPQLFTAYMSLISQCKSYAASDHFSWTSASKAKTATVQIMLESAERELQAVKFCGTQFENLPDNDSAIPFRDFVSKASSSIRAPEVKQTHATHDANVMQERTLSAIVGDSSANIPDYDMLLTMLGAYHTHASAGNVEAMNGTLEVIHTIGSKAVETMNADRHSVTLATLKTLLRQCENKSRELGASGKVDEDMHRGKPLNNVKTMDDKSAPIEIDSFTEYTELTHDEVIKLAGENPFNKDEASLTRMHTEYVGTNNSKDINSYLRNKAKNPQTLNNPAHESSIEFLDSAVKSHKLTAKHRFYRLVGADYLSYMFNIPVSSRQAVPAGAITKINRFAGRILTDPGFLSVGYKLDHLFSGLPIMLTFLCDPGTPAFPTDNFSTEAEFILGRGTKYMIMGARALGKTGRRIELGASIVLANKVLKDNFIMRTEGTYSGLEIFVKVIN